MKKWRIAVSFVLVFLMFTGCSDQIRKSTDNHSRREQSSQTTEPQSAINETEPSPLPTEPPAETVPPATSASPNDIDDPLKGALMLGGEGDALKPKDRLFDLSGCQKRTLNNAQRYEINIFLSNFAEQSFGPEFGTSFITADCDPMDMVDFAFWHCILNANLLAKSDYYGEASMTIDEINAITHRFFGKKVSLSDISGEFFRIEGDRVIMTVPIGDQHLQVTVTQAMWRRPDGNYIAAFAVYSLEPDDGNWQYKITDKSVYNMTPEAAQNSNAALLYYGVALVKPYIHLGSESYQLLAYQLMKEPFLSE